MSYLSINDPNILEDILFRKEFYQYKYKIQKPEIIFKKIDE